MTRERVGRRRLLEAFLAACLLAGAPAAEVQGQSASASERRTIERAERLFAVGRSLEARGTLRDYLDRAPGALAALALLSAWDARAGEAERTLPYAEAAVQAADDGRAEEVWVTALLASGRPDSALSVARRWRESRPDATEAILAEARALFARGESAEAIGVLERGAGTPGIDLALVDFLLPEGDARTVAEAWSRLLATDSAPLDAIVDDLSGVPVRRDELLGALSDALERAEGPALGRGALVALRIGDPRVARSLARKARAGGLTDEAGFLRDYVRASEKADLSAEVAWAARELVPLSPRPADRWRWQALAADRALLAGDTGRARREYRELANASGPGESPHEVASRRLFTLLARDPDSLGEARELLGRYTGAYPDSALALAVMHGELALGIVGAGGVEAAEASLREARRAIREPAAGPLDAVAARLALFAGRKDSVAARAGRSAARDELEADERTRRLELLTLAAVADSVELALVGRAALELFTSPRTFDPGETLRALAGLPGGPGRPVALAFLADRAAAAGRTEVAAALRQRIVEVYPASAEAPPALLDLARSAGPEEAVDWLEWLVIGYPESALAPMARRLLDELRGG